MRIFTSTSESLHGYISDISYILENIASGNLQLEERSSTDEACSVDPWLRL